MNTACRLCGSSHIDKKYRICTNMKIMGESFGGGVLLDKPVSGMRVCISRFF